MSLPSRKNSLSALVLGSLGIIYGDIGTSPLYAMNEVFFGHAHFAVNNTNVAGIASLIFYIFVLIICIKYVTFVLRADNNGEGGSFALLSILQNEKNREYTYLAFLLVLATGLLFGEGIITPAISVLSAMEGLKLVSDSFANYILPLTLVILFLIFSLQRFGSSLIGSLYGPIMLTWFATIGLLGLVQVLEYPYIFLEILNISNVFNLVQSMSVYNMLLILSSVFLVVTGGEALYADLGHFGGKAIKIGWYMIVFPALILNYAGQASYLLLGKTVAHSNLFYSLVPEYALVPMIILATLAAFIASVALVFGLYSVVAQAIALRLLPRIKILHTNELMKGQIYIPFVNWFLFFGTVILVLSFGSASALAAAYGLSVAGVMLTTSVAMYFIAVNVWQWRPTKAILIIGTFIFVDLIFVFANSIKFFQGGYIPVILGAIIFIIMSAWRWGNKLHEITYSEFTKNRNISWLINLKKKIRLGGGILSDDRTRNLVEIDRAAIFLTPNLVRDESDNVPTMLRIYIKNRGSIPKNIILLNIEQTYSPYAKNRYRVKEFDENLFAIKARFGFMEKISTGEILQYIYSEKLFDKKFARCSIEVSEEDFLVEDGVALRYKILSFIYKQLSRISVPRYRYFGFTGKISAGISKTMIPIHMNEKGAFVDIPEYQFGEEDTSKNPAPQQIRFRNLWKV